MNYGFKNIDQNKAKFIFVQTIHIFIMLILLTLTAVIGALLALLVMMPFLWIWGAVVWTAAKSIFVFLLITSLGPAFFALWWRLLIWLFTGIKITLFQFLININPEMKALNVLDKYDKTILLKVFRRDVWIPIGIYVVTMFVGLMIVLFGGSDPIVTLSFK